METIRVLIIASPPPQVAAAVDDTPEERQVFVAERSQTILDLQAALVQDIGDLGGVVREQFYLFNGLSADLSALSIPLLAQRSDAAYIEMAQTDIPPPLDVGRSMIRTDFMWSRGVKGAGETIALLDNGATDFHPDLDGWVAGNVDLVTDDYDGNDPTDRLYRHLHVWCPGRSGASVVRKICWRGTSSRGLCVQGISRLQRGSIPAPFGQGSSRARLPEGRCFGDMCRNTGYRCDGVRPYRISS